MKWVKTLLAACVAAAGTLLMAEQMPDTFQELRLQKDWKLFTGNPAISDAAPGAPYADTWQLPDGKELKARDLEIDEKGVDLNILLNERVPAGTPSVLVNSIESDSDKMAQIGVGVDWWFVCYLNGEELYSTLNNGGNRVAVPGREDHVINLPLKPGTNTLVLLTKGGSSTRRIAVGAVPYRDITPCNPSLRNGPYLVNPIKGGGTVRFTSTGKMAGGIAIRKKGEEVFRNIWETKAGLLLRDQDLHSINLSGLEPGAEYEYKLLLQNTDNNGIVELPELYSFIVPGDESRPVSIFFSGDTQMMPEYLGEQVEKLMKLPGAAEADYFFHAGDSSSTFNDTENDTFKGLVDVILKHTSHRPFYVPVRGNHEFFGKDASGYIRFFGTPDGKTYQAFSAGPCFVLALDSLAEEPDPFHEASYMCVMFDDYEAEEIAWLREVVKSEEFRNAPFRIVMTHAVPARNTTYKMTNVADNLQKVLEDETDLAQPVHLWLGGHVHCYWRSIPGTSNFLANRPTSTSNGWLPAENLLYTALTCDGPNALGTELSGTVLNVTPEEMEITSYTLDGEVMDHFKIYPDGSVEELPVIKELIKH